MKTTYLMIACLLIWSCQPDNGQEQQETESVSEQQVSVDSPKKQLVDPHVVAGELEIAALSFHSWYLNHINNFESNVPTDAFVVEGENGKCKLEMEPYFAELRKLGTISEVFIESERQRLTPCAGEMAETDYQAYMEGHVCDMLQYFYWIDSQETMEFVELEKISSEGDKASARLRFFDVFKDEKRYWETLHVDVQLAMEDSAWRITAIHHNN